MNTGQIIKSKLTNRFTTIPNEILRSEKLSLKAKGLLCMLLSLPSDWVLYKKQLPDMCKDGYDSVMTAFKELEENGYIISIQIRNELGHHKGWNYVVYDDPAKIENTTPDKPNMDKPNRGNPNRGNPLPDNTCLLKKDNTNTDLTKKDNTNNFEVFWNLYDKKEDREKSLKAWSKLKPEEKEKAILVVPDYVKSKPDKQYRKNPLTWLNGKCWNDEIITTQNDKPKYNSVKDWNDDDIRPVRLNR